MCSGVVLYDMTPCDLVGPDLATLERSSWTDNMTCTGVCGYNF